MTKILLTGSSGFIGQHIRPRLLSMGTIYDLKNDLTDHKKVEEEVAYINPDIIIHLAARTEVQKSFYEQVSFSEINYVGTVNLIESCCKLSKIPFFLLASTMEVYGWQPISDEVKITGTYKTKIAFDELTIPNPNAPYAVAKYASEKYLEYVSRSYGLKYAALRQTNSYGRKDNDFFITEQIITQMLKGNECNLGYDTPYRNFIYIDDLLDAWVSLIENRHKISNEIFTVGPDDPRQIKECANYIAYQLNWNGKINWNTKDPRPGEVYYLNSSNKKIKEKIGWEPKISYEEGIDRTIYNWKNLLK
jgi:nucleoside-diphosphate-sugar epimerase